MFSVASTAFYMFNANQLQWKWDFFRAVFDKDSSISKVNAHVYTLRVI